jgi:hypothetical protein
LGRERKMNSQKKMQAVKKDVPHLLEISESLSSNAWIKWAEKKEKNDVY